MLALFPFPLPYLTWRESVVGCAPSESATMQMTREWTHFNPPGMGYLGNGEAKTQSLGFVRWRSTEETREGRRCRHLRSEAYEKASELLKTEDVWVDVKTQEIVFQDERLASPKGVQRAESTYLPDHVAIRRTGLDGGIVKADLMPAEGMRKIQSRFQPMAKEPKEFLLVDGIGGSVRKVRIELAGRFEGRGGAERYAGNVYRFTIDGQEQKAMLTSEGETVRVEFSKEHALVLTSPTPSRRKEG